MSSIYTRTGDFGETSLRMGTRISKCDGIVDLYGSIDELNSHIGLFRSMLTAQEVQKFLEDIQKNLFRIGAYLAGDDIDLSHLKKQVQAMEERIDLMEKKLPPLHGFILPGGTTLASQVHVTRSVSRRVERKAVGIYKEYASYPHIQKHGMESLIQYMNRLSDFFFVLARFINTEEHGIEEVWKK